MGKHFLSFLMLDSGKITGSLQPLYKRNPVPNLPARSRARTMCDPVPCNLHTLLDPTDLSSILQPSVSSSLASGISCMEVGQAGIDMSPTNLNPNPTISTIICKQEAKYT